jgi:hypothetical protein
MNTATEKENYQWVCQCDKRGRFAKFHKAVKNAHRHNLEHERKLEWGFSTYLIEEEK